MRVIILNDKKENPYSHAIEGFLKSQSVSDTVVIVLPEPDSVYIENSALLDKLYSSIRSFTNMSNTVVLNFNESLKKQLKKHPEEMIRLDGLCSIKQYPAELLEQLDLSDRVLFPTTHHSSNNRLKFNPSLYLKGFDLVDNAYFANAEVFYDLETLPKTEKGIQLHCLVSNTPFGTIKEVISRFRSESIENKIKVHIYGWIATSENGYTIFTLPLKTITTKQIITILSDFYKK